ncbi:ribonuclease H-like domain-containing protein [Tanacetum coccineum]
MADQDTPPPTITAMKIPIIKKGEYDIWSMRMRQYICHTYHNLWDIIVNGDLEDEATPSGEQSSPPVPKTAKQLAFHNVPDAKSLWAAIKSRFGGNEESKKMQKNVLKHQFENFEDINQKFLRSLPPSWSQIALIMRNKPDIDEVDIDDLYNNLRVYEDELKRSSGSNSASQNLAFLSSENTNSTNEVSIVNRDFGMEEYGLRGIGSSMAEKDFMLENVDAEGVKAETKELDGAYDFEVETSQLALMANLFINYQVYSDSEGYPLKITPRVIYHLTGTSMIKPKSVNETVVSKSKINRDEVIIGDWTLDDEDDVCVVKAVSSVKPNVTQAVRNDLTFNLFSVSQMCDKKNSVLYTEFECLIFSPSFKLLDESQVVLRAHRKDGVYSLDLKNIVLLEGHLVRGLPLKSFCETSLELLKKGKQYYKASGERPNLVRCDNGTEFKNYAMNELCAKKGIKREFSVARTPQQNGVAERKNRTLIEAARTMLADSLLPIPFWAEAVNTACYVLNRVLVTKPQNKTPYELLIGKFDGKSDEGYLLGYSTSSSSGNDKGPTQEYILLPLQPHRTRIPVKDVVQDAQAQPSENASPNKDKQFEDENRKIASQRRQLKLQYNQLSRIRPFVRLVTVECAFGKKVKQQLMESSVVHDKQTSCFLSVPVQGYGIPRITLFEQEACLESDYAGAALTGNQQLVELISCCPEKPNEVLVSLGSGFRKGQLWIKVKAQHNQLNPYTPVDPLPSHPNHLNTSSSTSSIRLHLTIIYSITTSFPHHYINITPHFSPPRSSKHSRPEVIIPEVLEVSMEKALKRKSKKVLISESEGEEPEDQGRKIQDINDDPLVSLVKESMKEKLTDFVSPTKALGEAQEEEISPTILEAATTLSKIDTGLDAEEEINTGREEINTGIEEVSTGSTKVNSGTASKRGQREGKAQMVEEDIQATYKTKEQMRQEEADGSGIKLQAQLDKGQLQSRYI